MRLTVFQVNRRIKKWNFYVVSSRNSRTVRLLLFKCYVNGPCLSVTVLMKENKKLTVTCWKRRGDNRRKAPIFYAMQKFSNLFIISETYRVGTMTIFITQCLCIMIYLLIVCSHSKSSSVLFVCWLCGKRVGRVKLQAPAMYLVRTKLKCRTLLFF
jgi:hypothetical protein